jgi:hypothetical protein
MAHFAYILGFAMFALLMGVAGGFLIRFRHRVANFLAKNCPRVAPFLTSGLPPEPLPAATWRARLVALACFLFCLALVGDALATWYRV